MSYLHASIVRDDTSKVKLTVTSPAKIHQNQLIDFVYSAIIKTIKKWSKNDIPGFDRDFNEIPIKVQKLTDKKLRGFLGLYTSRVCIFKYMGVNVFYKDEGRNLIQIAKPLLRYNKSHQEYNKENKEIRPVNNCSSELVTRVETTNKRHDDDAIETVTRDDRSIPTKRIKEYSLVLIMSLLAKSDLSTIQRGGKNNLNHLKHLLIYTYIIFSTIGNKKPTEFLPNLLFLKQRGVLI